MSAPEIPATFVKRGHSEGCGGALFRLKGVVGIDRIGRVGNGMWVAHVYECNRRFAGCKARVLVTERAVRQLAVDALGGEP